MAEFRLTPTPALGTGNPIPFETGGYRLEENTSLALASVAARTGCGTQVASGLAGLLGSPAPEPNSFVSGDRFAAFWIGPDQWMVAAPQEGHELLAHELKAQFENAASITEQNDGWVCLDVTGPDINTVFERLTAADIHASNKGDAVRTVIEHVGCFVLCMEENQHYRVFAGRSFAHSLHHALQTCVKSTRAYQALSVE